MTPQIRAGEGCDGMNAWLDEHEMRRFRAWCQQGIDSNDGLLRQLASMPHSIDVLQKQLAAENAALGLVIKLLSAESVEIRKDGNP